MEDGRIVIPAVHPDKIRMDEAELVSLFNVVAPTLYNPQIEMFARFKMKSSFHKTKRII